MSATTLRVTALELCGQSLQRMVDDGQLRQVYPDYAAISTINEFPAIWYKHGPDRAYTCQNGPGTLWEVQSSIALGIMGRQDDETLGKDTEDLIHLVRRRFVADHALWMAQGLKIMGMAVSRDPLLIALWGEFAHAIIEIEYNAMENY